MPERHRRTTYCSKTALCVTLHGKTDTPQIYIVRIFPSAHFPLHHFPSLTVTDGSGQPPSLKDKLPLNLILIQQWAYCEL